MITLFESLQAWHWMLLGIVLLGLEALGIGGFLIGAGIAAFTTCLVAMSGAHWTVQFGVFAFLSVFFTVIYFKRFRKFNEAREGSENINNKMAALVGRTGKVVVANKNGVSKVQIGDTLWVAHSKADLEEDDEVSVKSYDGTTLIVNKLI